MAGNAGTMELLARELARALQPLEQRLAASDREAFLAELGLRLPGGLGTAAAAIGTVTVQVGGLAPVIARLTAAIDDDVPARIVQEGVALLGTLREVIDALGAVGPALDAAVNAAAGLTAAQRARLRAEAAQLPGRLLEFALISYIEGRSRGAIELLTLTGILDDFQVPVDPADPTVLPVRRRALHIDRLLAMITDPAGWLGDTFDFGRQGFDGLKVWRRVAAFLEGRGLPFTFITPPGGPPVLDAYLLRLSVDPTIPPAATVRLRVPATEDVSQTIPVGTLWALTLGVAARFDAGLEARIQAPLDLELRPPTGSLELEARAGARAERAGEVIVLLGQAGSSRLEVTRFAIELGLRAAASLGGSVSVEPSAWVELAGGHVLIDLSGGDGFISTITGGGRIESTFDLRALWSPSSGLQFEGSGALDLAVPIHLELGPVEVTTLYLSAGIAEDGSVPVEVSGAFKAALGPIKAAVDRVGLSVVARFPDGGGNLGPVDLGFAFKPPSGVGLAIDAGVVSGGGFLYVDAARGEYAGALELEFANFLELKAIGLISTRMPDGSAGFSLLIVIAVEFGTGIQLGYGFTLLAVGGLIGLNRRMDLQAMVEGVRTGAIESVMFPRDVVANAPRIISDLRAFFPPEQGTFLIGPMAKIGWGTPTLISVSLGVIIEIPGNIAIIGVLRCALPTVQTPLLVLQVAFIGAIEFDKSRVWFFAQLFDSRILMMTIEGGMGLLVDWSDNPDFVLTVGGFHPAFRPAPLPFPVPQRLSVDILNRPGQLIRVSGYFAVTSNTVQFGARAELRLGFGAFGIEGHLAFDALFRFSPFSFIIAISAGVSLKAFGVGLFGIKLRFQLEGPAPWRAHGQGSISLLFFEISADFDITWGESRDTTLPPIDVLPLLAGELAKLEGWQTQLPTGGTRALVNLRPLPETDELVLHPLGTLFVRQRSIPLGIRLDRVGAQTPRDGKRFSVAPAPDSGLVLVSVPDEKFAMTQFQNMDDAAKLSRPAYENQDAGLELTAAQGALASARVVRRSARYEQIVIDSLARAGATARAGGRRLRLLEVAATRPTKLTSVSPAVFTQLLSGASTSRSPLSQREARLRQPFEASETVRLGEQRFVVAYRRNNLQAFPPSSGLPQTVTFRSQAAAFDALTDWVAEDPSLAGTLHVLLDAEAAAPPTPSGSWTATTNPLPGATAWESSTAAAARLTGGRVLVAGGADAVGQAVTAAALFDPVANTWSATGALTTARRHHSLTRLDDGRTLAAGGRGTAALASAELYDPLSGSWSATQNMATARFGHSATPLAGGKVLVAGGTGAGHTLASAELFDPATGTWTATGAMTDARSGHRAVRLADGRVLVTGGTLATGRRDAALAYCELYEPTTGRWTPTGSLAVPRAGHESTLLADGTVLVTGGDAPGVPVGGWFRLASLDAAERYDPNTEEWTPVRRMPGGRGRHGAVLLRTGRVLVVGGTSGPAHDTGYRNAILYDPATDTWTHTGALTTGRWDLAAVELSDGRVLVAGGRTRSGTAAPEPGTDVLTATAEIYTP